MRTETTTRVLISFDCGHPSEELLQLLPRLLGTRPLELTGLYVEDEDLLRAAALPGLREVSLNGQVAEMDVDRLQKEQAAEASAIRSTFEAVAARMRMQHRFLVTRGRASEELTRIADDSDFVLITRALRTSGLRPRSGVHYDRLLRQSRNILFVNEPWRSGSSVVVLGGTGDSLDVARRFSEAETLTVVLAAKAPEPHGLETDPRLLDGERRVTLAEWTEEAIADLCLAQDARLLIVPKTHPLNWEELLPRLMDRLPCSVLKLC